MGVLSLLFFFFFSSFSFCLFGIPLYCFAVFFLFFFYFGFFLLKAGFDWQIDTHDQYVPM
jgi:hypothetical protein